MLKVIFTGLVRVFKNKDFKLDQKVDSSYLLSLILQKAFEAFRGLIKLQKIVYIGSNVTIRSRKNLKLGRSVTISSYSSLDALGKEGIKIGSYSSIGSFSQLKVSGTISDLGLGIEIGDNVGIGEFAHIGGAGKVVIGKNTIAGSYLSIHPENHNTDQLDELIRLQGVNRKGILIGENCWLGAKVTFLDGSKIGNGCVVAAGAVVRGEFPDNAIIGGVPARILKIRSEK